MTSVFEILVLLTGWSGGRGVPLHIVTYCSHYAPGGRHLIVQNQRSVQVVSLAFDQLKPRYLYAGLKSGATLVFDTQVGLNAKFLHSLLLRCKMRSQSVWTRQVSTSLISIAIAAIVFEVHASDL